MGFDDKSNLVVEAFGEDQKEVKKSKMKFSSILYEQNCMRYVTVLGLTLLVFFICFTINFIGRYPTWCVCVWGIELLLLGSYAIFNPPNSQNVFIIPAKIMVAMMGGSALMIALRESFIGSPLIGTVSAISIILLLFSPIYIVIEFIDR